MNNETLMQVVTTTESSTENPRLHIQGVGRDFHTKAGVTHAV